MNENYKWQKLLWSIVVITVIVLFFKIVYAGSNQGPGFGFIVLALWPGLFCISLTILLLRLFRLLIKRYSFIYTLAGVVNLATGIAGIYLGLISADYGSFRMYNKFAIWNILLALFILCDVFIKEIGGFRKCT